MDPEKRKQLIDIILEEWNPKTHQSITIKIYKKVKKPRQKPRIVKIYCRSEPKLQ